MGPWRSVLSRRSGGSGAGSVLVIPGRSLPGQASDYRGQQRSSGFEPQSAVRAADWMWLKDLQSARRVVCLIEQLFV